MQYHEQSDPTKQDLKLSSKSKHSVNRMKLDHRAIALIERLVKTLRRELA